MNKTLKGLLGAYKSLKALVDPSFEGNPYVRDEIVEKTFTTKEFNYFPRRRLAIR